MKKIQCYHRIKSDSLAFLLLTVVLTNLILPVHGSIICFFLQTPRCIFGLGAIMHRGTPGNEQCVETCGLIFLAIFDFFQGYTCGSCSGGTGGLLTPQQNNPSTFGLDVWGVNIAATDAQAFINAANTWNSIITTDKQGPYASADLNRLSPANDLLSGCAYPSNGVDDLFICADIRTVDGVGNVLGAAAPSLKDSRTGLPVNGFMFFDEADIARLRSQGTYETVILHEMGHILGIGTLWMEKGVQSGVTNCPYTGSFARREYQRLSTCPNNPPTEQNGGAGSRCSHWMEKSCLGNELMSSALSPNSRLTSITIGSLQDIGYSVDYTKNQDVGLNRNGCCRRNLKQPRRKTLSDEGMSIAKAFGQQILSDLDQASQSRGVSVDETYGIVSVLMLENNEIFEVWVTRDDGTM